MRIGQGYDVHRLVEGRALVLGGVKVPYERGLDGHSDADVLVHAVMDALLGAAALGDIGKLFPDSDERSRGADSLLLLAEVARRVRAEGMRSSTSTPPWWRRRRSWRRIYRPCGRTSPARRGSRRAA